MMYRLIDTLNQQVDLTQGLFYRKLSFIYLPLHCSRHHGFIAVAQMVTVSRFHRKQLDAALARRLSSSRKRWQACKRRSDRLMS